MSSQITAVTSLSSATIYPNSKLLSPDSVFKGFGLTSIKVSSEIPAITTVLHAYGTALKNCSTEEVLGLYTNDGVIMAPHFPASVGTEALRKSYERIFSTIKLTIDFDILEIVNMSPEWAFARTTAAGTKAFLKGGEEVHSNQELFVLQKVRGEWKIARYCFSSMKPLVK